MIRRLTAWLHLFRIVNLPTVPGDVLAGAAPCVAQLLREQTTGAVIRSPAPELTLVWSAVGASCLLYLFGLVQNDLIGAKTDTDRPIPQGEISVFAARVAAIVCLAGAFLIGVFAGLPRDWFAIAGALVSTITLYNLTKWPVLMGLCRGLNVACGTMLYAAYFPAGLTSSANLSPVLQGFGVAVLLGLYIACVTHYSEGEETDPARKQRVGALIGSLIYLQLAALMIFRVHAYLIAGAVLLVTLRLLRRLLPKVSAS